MRPVSSAEYSRERETANWMRVAASGARKSLTVTAKPPAPRAFVAIASVAAENHSPLGDMSEVRNGTQMVAATELNQDVAVATCPIRGQHSFQFFIGEQIENALVTATEA